MKYIDTTTGYLWDEEEMKAEFGFFAWETDDTRTFEQAMDDSLRDGILIPFDEEKYIVCDDGMTYPKDEYVLVNGDGMNFEAAVNYMDDEIREQLHRELAPCDNQTFMDAYLAAHMEKYGEEFKI